MNSNFKAELACKIFDGKCIQKGYISSVPIVEVRYDRIVEIKGRFYKFQIKYCNNKSKNSANAFHLNLRTSRNGKNNKLGYSKKEIDYLIVYLPTENKMYCFPNEIFENKQFLSLRTKKTKNNQKYFDISKYEF